MNTGRTDAVVLTGGSGFLGGLIAAALLAAEPATVILPIRPSHDLEDVLWPIRFAMRSLGCVFTDEHRRRLRVVRVKSPDHLENCADEIAGLRVTEVIHCAGCLDYFDSAALEAVNVALTHRLLDLARRWRVDRFTYISTAYSCGYIDGVAPEAPHALPIEDPTDYTRTKRDAEWLVVKSGLSFRIIRPSIVIGTSDDGQYTGKRYGVYQLWNGLERLMCRTWAPVLHIVAPEGRKVHLVHQDSFQRAFLASRRHLPENSVFHISSPIENAPAMRQLWEMWIHACARPERVVYYDRVGDLPMRAMDARQRAFLSLAWTNIDIASRHWNFATDNLRRLIGRGLDYRDVTIHSLERCQQRFIEESVQIQAFLARYSGETPAAPGANEGGVSP